MLIRLVRLLSIKCSNLAFEKNDETLDPPLRDIAFLAIDCIVKNVRLQMLCPAGWQWLQKRTIKLFADTELATHL